MNEKDILNKIKNLMLKFPDGISANPVEIVTLYILYLYKENSEGNNFIDKETFSMAVERSFEYLKNFDYYLPAKPETVMESLLKKKFILYSSTVKNCYYLSEISSNILNGLFSKDLETISDVESNLHTIHIALKDLENSSLNEINGFLKHTFYDLIYKIDRKISQIKEEIIDIKKEIKDSTRKGDEDSFSEFLKSLEEIRNLLKEISTSLSKYSSYNQILYSMGKLEKKADDDDETIENIHKAYKKLFGIKNELENTLADVTDFINRHVSLITAQISISELDNILEFQKKLLSVFCDIPIVLSKPKRMKVKDYRFKWKNMPRKPVLIEEENIITSEEIDLFEKQEIKRIINYLFDKLSKKDYLDFIEEIMKFEIVENNLPKYYNKILFEISDYINLELDETEYFYDDCFLSNIKIKLKQVEKNAQKF